MRLRGKLNEDKGEWNRGLLGKREGWGKKDVLHALGDCAQNFVALHKVGMTHTPWYNHII